MRFKAMAGILANALPTSESSLISGIFAMVDLALSSETRQESNEQKRLALGEEHLSRTQNKASFSCSPLLLSPQQSLLELSLPVVCLPFFILDTLVSYKQQTPVSFRAKGFCHLEKRSLNLPTRTTTPPIKRLDFFRRIIDISTAS
jgi:hypothetical protein